MGEVIGKWETGFGRGLGNEKRGRGLGNERREWDLDMRDGVGRGLENERRGREGDLDM